MNCNELRIGNWIEFNGEQFEVNSISDKPNTTRKYWKPILLTEDWLKKFGFEYYSMYNGERFFEINSIKLEMTDAGLLYGKVIIKYVHTLQKLIFALTNKELCIS